MPDFEQQRMEEDRERELRDDAEKERLEQERIEQESAERERIEQAAQDREDQAQAREAEAEPEPEPEPHSSFSDYSRENDPDSSSHYTLQYNSGQDRDKFSRESSFALVTNEAGEWFLVEIYWEEKYDYWGDPYEVEKIRIIKEYGYPADTNALFIAFDDIEYDPMPDSVPQMDDPPVPLVTDSSWINIDDVDFRYEDYTAWSDGLVGFVPDEEGNWYIVDLDGWYADPPGKIILMIPAGTFDIEFRGRTYPGYDEGFEGAYLAYLRGGESTMNQFIEDTKNEQLDQRRDAQSEQDRLNEERQQAEVDEAVQYWKDRLTKAESDDEADAQEIGRLTIERNVYEKRWQDAQAEIERLKDRPQGGGGEVRDPPTGMSSSNLGFLALIGILGVIVYTRARSTEG